MRQLSKATRAILTEAEILECSNAIRNTWQTIGGDCEAATGGYLPVSHQVELVFDASHLDSYGDLSEELTTKLYSLSRAQRYLLGKIALS